MPQDHHHDHQCPVCDLTDELVELLDSYDLHPLQHLRALNNAMQVVLISLHETPEEEPAVHISDAQGRA
jgi:hypothetical protein